MPALPLEQTLGYTFGQPALLQEALTHASLAYESQRPAPNNQRLEFLGDAVLQLVLSELLYRSRPKADEGELTTTRASLVSTKALAVLARQHGLGEHLIMGRGEAANGGRERDNTLADSVEAIVGAAYLDGGIPAAMQIVRSLYGSRIESPQRPDAAENPKGLLQEIIQAHATDLPRYSIVGESGPAHSRVFTATITWRGEVIGEGTGRSKKDAEMEAARIAVSNASALLSQINPVEKLEN